MTKVMCAALVGMVLCGCIGDGSDLTPEQRLAVIQAIVRNNQATTQRQTEIFRDLSMQRPAIIQRQAPQSAYCSTIYTGALASTNCTAE